MARLILDASAAIAFLDAEDVHHKAALATVAAGRLDERVLPASAYAEILVRAHRAGRAALDEIERFVRELAITVQPIDADIARRAAALRAAHTSLRLPDALVIATGDALEGTVLTADRQWTKLSRRVRLI